MGSEFISERGMEIVVLSCDEEKNILFGRWAGEFRSGEFYLNPFNLWRI